MFSPTLEPSTDPDADQPYQRPAYASQQSHRHTLAPWARRRCKPEARVVSECGVERTVSWEVSVTVDRLPAELLTCAPLDALSASDRDYPRLLIRSGT